MIRLVLVGSMCLSLACQRLSAGSTGSSEPNDAVAPAGATIPTGGIDPAFAALVASPASPATSTPTPTSTSTAAAATSAQIPLLELGQTAELPAYRVRLVSQRDCAKPGASSSRSALRSWAAELEVTNTGIAMIPVNPFYATVQDPDRFTYTTSLSTCGALLPSQLLGPRETVRGFVPFDLPRATTSVTLTYQPFLRGNAVQSARFRLEL